MACTWQWVARTLLASLLVQQAITQPNAKKLLLDFKASGSCSGDTLLQWDMSSALEDFPGIRVDPDGIVTALIAPLIARLIGPLIAPYNDLCGRTLPPAWSTLTGLRELGLARSNLSGPLPPAWSALQAMTYLDLSSNAGLTGPLLPAWSALKSLATLYLSSNPGLTGPLPPAWSVLQAMTYLDLSSNPGLTGPLPPAWSALKSLAYLDLSSNAGLTGPLLPAWSALKSLATLYLSSNPGLTGLLPPAWSALKSLARLDLSSNPGLTGPLPPAWSALSALQYLYLSSNPGLTGPLLPAWSALSTLQYLYLSSNPGLTGQLPPAWSALKNLSTMNLYNNSLTGTVPTAWSKLPYDLRNNSVTPAPSSKLQALLLGFKRGQASCSSDSGDPVLPTWDHMVNLNAWSGVTLENGTVTTLDLFSSSLCGPLPPAWSVLSALTYLSLSSNPGLTGPLPPAWSALKSLAILDLASNAGLTGPLPPAWSALLALQYLDLSSNAGLTGPLPPAWSALKSLARLSLSSNPDLSGPLPPAWSALKSLASLSLSSNPDLTGPLLPVWSALKSLTYLDLSSNPCLTGPLPPAWSALSALQYLDLSSNPGLSGQLPVAWSKLDLRGGLGLHVKHLNRRKPPSDWVHLDVTKLTALSVESVDGPIPAWISQLTGLNYLNMSSSSLEGTLPAGMTAMTQLSSLDLSNNSLDGTLPAWMSALTQLYSLDLSSNSLDGTLPVWTTLIGLTSLDLRNNNFSGTIPAAWSTLQGLVYTGQLQSLVVIKLAGNRLHGPIPTSWSKNEAWWNALVYIDVAGNQLTGPLPPFPTSIKFFNGSNNSFSGTLPAIPPSLVYLHLGHNSLSGPVPDVQNSSLVFLDASQNHLSALPQVFHAASAVYLNIANNTLQGTLPSPGYNHSLVYCDLGGNQLSGGVPMSWHQHTWQYLALDSNQLSGPLYKWSGNVTVLLLQNNPGLNGSLPGQWPFANASRVLSFASTDISDLPRNWSKLFRNLSLLDVSGTKAKLVPLLWMDPRAFNGTGTVLRLGSLWTTSKKDNRWRKEVCIQKSLNDKLIGSLQKSVLPDEVQSQVQGEVNSALAGLTQTLRSLNVTGVTFDIGTLQLRQGSVPPVTKEDMCDNPLATTIVGMQWAFFGSVMFCLSVLYVLEARWHLLSSIKLGGRSCLSLDFQQRSAHPVTLAMTLVRSAKYASGLLLYWFDVITDIILIVVVWPMSTWPRYVLLCVFVLHYIVTVVLLSWKLRVRVKYRLLMLLFGLPLVPVLDTLMFAYLAVEGHVQSRSALDNMQWQELFEMREVLEVFLEALPTAVLQSLIFIVGNKPEVGVYLQNRLYILSAIASTAQILRLLAVVLWDSLQTETTPWAIVWRKLTLGGAAKDGNAEPEGTEEPKSGMHEL